MYLKSRGHHFFTSFVKRHCKKLTFGAERDLWMAPYLSSHVMIRATVPMESFVSWVVLEDKGDFFFP